MTLAPSTYLIIGADSFIGRGLWQRLHETGVSVVGTTRRRELVNQARGYLDLAVNATGWKCPWPVRVAIICAGVTKLAECRCDPVASAQVNIAGVSAVARTLAARGVFVVFLSTGSVFDGTVPHQLADAPRSPMTEYGRQKAAAEERVLALGDQIAIVRFTKVLSPGTPLLCGWRQALAGNQVIHPFSDMVMAPVPLTFAVDVLQRLARTQLPGVFQVSADEDITYEKAAVYLARRLGNQPSLVQPVRTSAADLNLEHLPQHTTLDTTRLRQEFGMAPPAVWTTIDSVLES